MNVEQMETYRTLAVLSRCRALGFSAQTLFLKDAVQQLTEEGVYCIPEYQYEDSQADLGETG